MVDENSTVAPNEPSEVDAAPDQPEPSEVTVPAETGVDAPEPPEVVAPVTLEPEVVLQPPASAVDSQPIPPPPPSGPAPGGYAPPPPPPPQAQQGQYQPPPSPSGAYAPKSRTVAGVLGLLLGGWGVHKFYLGYTNEGLILLAGNLLWVIGLGWIPNVIGFVEGIIYLTKTDADFQQTYVSSRKPWF